MKDHSIGADRLVCFTCTCEVSTRRIIEQTETEISVASKILHGINMLDKNELPAETWKAIISWCASHPLEE